MTTLSSRADVPTDAPARYAKQLVSHLGRKVSFTEDTEGTWTAVIGDARGRITVGDGVLGLRAEAPREEGLTLVEHVLGSHLERFGARAGLTVTWHRDPS
jgi:uncharacterized protein